MSITPDQSSRQKPPRALRTTRLKADEILAKHEHRGRELLDDSEAASSGMSRASWAVNFEQWCRVTQDAVRHIYSTTEIYDEFRRRTSRIRRKANQSDDETFANQCAALSKGVGLLAALRESLLYADEPSELRGPKRPTQAAIDSRKVFVVHGHDHDLRNAVELQLRRLNFDPIILEEKPHGG
jgi:hypothetical protein